MQWDSQDDRMMNDAPFCTEDEFVKVHLAVPPSDGNDDLHDKITVYSEVLGVNLLPSAGGSVLAADSSHVNLCLMHLLPLTGMALPT